MTEGEPELFTERHRQMLRDLADADARGAHGQPSIDGEDPAPPTPVSSVALDPPVFQEVAYDDFAVTLSVRLYHPFVIEGRRIADVEILPPRFDHVEAMLEKRISRMALYASMCGLSEAALGALRWPDAGRVMAAFAVAYPD